MAKKSRLPSPPPPSSAAAARERQEEPSPDVQAALRLLPPDAHTFTASMGSEDKEVLAFLIARPTGYENAAADRKFDHAPGLSCECFECYGEFWWRWQRSPVRRLIDQAVEAFDGHLRLRMGGGGEERKSELGREVGEKKAEAEVLPDTTDLSLSGGLTRSGVSLVEQ